MRSGSGKKIPAQVAPTSKEKRPFKGAPTAEDSSGKLSWRFSLVDLEGPYGWASATSDHLQDAHAKLAAFEESSWQQLAGRKHHRIDVAALCATARRRLEEIEHDEVDSLYTLHLNGLQRVWGIVWDDVYYLLWWDPNHTVYPVEKKHT